MRHLRILLLLSWLPAAATAQEPPAATFGEAVRVEVVNVEVFVTDREGRPVTDLSAEDFEVLEDGEARPIVNFYAEAGPSSLAPAGRARPETAGPLGTSPAATPAPEQRLHLLVFVDNTHLRPAHRKRALDGVRTFLSQRLEPSATVAVASLGRSLTVHSDFLSDRTVLAKILDQVEQEAGFQSANDSERRQIAGELLRGETFGQRGEPLTAQPLLSRIRAYAQSEYERGRVTLDALSRFVAMLSGVPGRKAMLYVADGIPMRPGEELFNTWAEGSPSLNLDVNHELANYDLLRQFQALGREANASGVTLYTLDAAGDHTTEVRAAAIGGRVPSEALSIVEANYRDPQELTAKATGGRRLVVGPRLDEDLEVIARDLSTFYSLGFTPAEGGLGETRRLKVRARRPGLVVRHRESYQRRSPEQEISDAILAALLFGTSDNPLEISLEADGPQPREDGSTLVPLQLEVPVASIALLPKGEVHGAQLSLFVTTQTADGWPRPIQKIPFHANIPADKLQEALGRSLSYTLPLVVRPGDQQVAVGVQDEIAGTVSAVRLTLDPPPPRPRPR